MEGEMKNLLLVWTTALLCIFGCHKVATFIPAGATRLCVFVPVFCIFFYLPLLLHTVHFSGGSSFIITWLANFKLLLFAFDKGPLYSNPPLPISKFITTACLPIKIITTTTQSNNNKSKSSSSRSIIIINYSVKLTVFALLLKLYEYKDYFNPFIKMSLFCIHIYIVLDVGLAIFAYITRAMFGFELEPQFNEPYLATSLQDFWGKRWNLMVTGILHPTVYLPVRTLSGKVLPKEVASFPAVMSTFIVSGLMHELIFYYIGRLRPTWEVTWFFVIHGVLAGGELVVKRAVDGRVRLPAVVSGAVALGLVVWTSFWLFFPPFLRCDTEVRSCKEFVAFMELVVHGRFVGPNHVSCPYF